MMKKIKEVFAKKDKKSKKSKLVTQANLDESRDEILAKGKKFRYPFQYAKHRVMINAIVIGVLAVAMFSFVGWLQLYKLNNTGDVAYRFTRVIALPVAEIDGVKVRFSDYLMLYRSSVASIERQQGAFDNSDDSRGQLAYYQRQALNMAEEYSYALAKLNEAGQGVTEAEIDEVVNKHRMIEGELRSEESFAGIVRNNFDLNLTEYRRMIQLSLAKRKYSMLFDEKAKTMVYEAQSKLAANGGDMHKLMEEYAGSELIAYESTNGLVERSNLDGGRAEAAFGLVDKNSLSQPFLSANGDGIYIVKMTDKKDDKLAYESIWVRFSSFDESIRAFRQDGKVRELIELEEK